MMIDSPSAYARAPRGTALLVTQKPIATPGTTKNSRLQYASANPRISGVSLIGQSSPQAQDLEVTDERDTIVAVEATRRYSGLGGGAYEGAAGFRAKPGGLLPCAGVGSEVLYPVEAQATWARGCCKDCRAGSTGSGRG